MGQVGKVQSIHRMIADLCDEVQTNTSQERRLTKEEIRKKKEEIKTGYDQSANVQDSEASFLKNSGYLTGILQIGSLILPTDGIQKAVQMIISESGSQFVRGCESHLNGRVTKIQGGTQIGQKELDLFQSKLQTGSDLQHKVEEILATCQRDEKQAMN
jgi:hypothetical protein